MENFVEKINKSAVKFLTPLTTEETFKTIVSEAKKIIGGEYGTIFLEDGEELKRVYADADFFYKFSQRKHGNVYKTFRSRKPRLLSLDNNDFLHPELRNQGITSIILIPLFYKDRSFGVLTMHFTSSHEFTEKDLHLFTLYGALASMAIRKTQLYDETKSALETRDLFISLASHELRTPLTSINGYIQLLYSKLSKQDGVESKWVQELYDESKRLTNLIKELLEVNRIKQGQLNYELRECRVNEVVENAIKRYSFINPDKEIQFQKEATTDHIIGDHDKLLQMITALLNNADKFSPSRSPIVVTTKNTKSQVIIQVKDEGSGIAREDIQKIFDGFYKVSKQTEGLGVGLLLAKHIIQYHHGTITVKSKVKKGTTAEVRLPLLK